MGPTVYPITSVTNYHYSLHNNPEKRTSHLLHGGSLRSYRHAGFTYGQTTYLSRAPVIWQLSVLNIVKIIAINTVTTIAISI